jgi:hypothetical protein
LEMENYIFRKLVSYYACTIKRLVQEHQNKREEFHWSLNFCLRGLKMGMET